MNEARPFDPEMITPPTDGGDDEILIAVETPEERYRELLAINLELAQLNNQRGHRTAELFKRKGEILTQFTTEGLVTEDAVLQKYAN